MTNKSHLKKSKSKHFGRVSFFYLIINILYGIFFYFPNGRGQVRIQCNFSQRIELLNEASPRFHDLATFFQIVNQLIQHTVDKNPALGRAVDFCHLNYLIHRDLNGD